MKTDRLEKQIGFVVEIDRLKGVLRRTVLTDRSRPENSAEHSWHLAVMALFLSEYAGETEIDLHRILKMLLIHDLVEIEAGDTFCYDEGKTGDQKEREKRAARRIFAILPPDQTEELHSLWKEFEAGTTPESRFARALDRLQPVLQNYHSDGGSWRIHGVHKRQVLARLGPLQETVPALWSYAAGLLDDAVDRGFLSP